MKEITLDHALKEIRRDREQFPDSPAEVSAIRLMRRIDSWEEYRAILKALDQVIGERS